MWFGTRAFMQEIPDPAPEPEFPDVGWDEVTQYLGGGLGVSSSVTKHGEYVLVWDVMERSDVRKITDYADGVYGADERGAGPFYWIDPVSIDQNVLPQSWATPSLAGYDGVPLAGDVRPVLSANTDQSQGYPVEKATYTLTAETVCRSLFVPIPPGHSAWVGIHGDAGAAGRVKVTPFAGSTPGAVVHPTILSSATVTRVNTEIEGTGLELSLDNSTPGACPLLGMIVQILPDGVLPETGGFISGQGNSGCRFIGRPMKTPYGTNRNLVGLSVKLGEVGEWE